MEVGDTIKLKGISLKGKNRIRECGEEWVIQKIAQDTPYRDKGDMLITPVVQRSPFTKKFPEIRWIAKHDKDFEIDETQ